MDTAFQEDISTGFLTTGVQHHPAIYHCGHGDAVHDDPESTISRLQKLAAPQYGVVLTCDALGGFLISVLWGFALPGNPFRHLFAERLLLAGEVDDLPPGGEFRLINFPHATRHRVKCKGGQLVRFLCGKIRQVIKETPVVAAHEAQANGRTFLGVWCSHGYLIDSVEGFHVD